MLLLLLFLFVTGEVLSFISATSPPSQLLFISKGSNCCGRHIHTWNNPPFHKQMKMSYRNNKEVRQSTTDGDGDGDTSSPQPYRSIGEVVGGLHGGKYLFDNGVSGFGGDGFFTAQSSFSGEGSCGSNGEMGGEEDEEMPNWAKKMQPPSGVSSTGAGSGSGSGSDAFRTISVPSNSNPMDGMTYSANVRIKNDERTWEKFHTKIMCGENGRFFSYEESSKKPFYVMPRSGHLAPRGGASNACDESNPYSDSVTLKIIHSANEIVAEGQEWWLVAGTEEEKWYFRLVMGEE